MTKRKRNKRKPRILKRIGIAAVAIVLTTALIYFIMPGLFYSIYNRAIGSYRPASDDSYNGIDVSHHNGIIHWDKVATDKNVEFAYIKATEGYRHKDKRYAANSEGAKRAGIKVGAYHLLTTKMPIATQVSYFCSIAHKDQQDLIPMVDIEEDKVRTWTDQQLQDSLRKFLNLAKQHYGTEPVIYCSHKLYKNKLAPHFDDNILFLARYGKEPPLLDDTDKQHDIWQFTEHGTVSGISGDVDLDRFGKNTSINDIKLK